MRFRDVGVQLEYDGDFKIYREDGISRYGKPDYLFLYFHTECCVVLDKQPVYVKPPSVILYDIGAKQHYYAVNDSYKDDFVHFWLDDSRSFVDGNQSADEYGDSPAGKYVDSFDDETTLSGIYFDE